MRCVCHCCDIQAVPACFDYCEGHREALNFLNFDECSHSSTGYLLLDWLMGLQPSTRQCKGWCIFLELSFSKGWPCKGSTYSCKRGLKFGPTGLSALKASAWLRLVPTLHACHLLGQKSFAIFLCLVRGCSSEN